MASISRSGKGWRAQVRRGAVKESRSFSTKAAAREWALSLEAEILAGKAGKPAAKTLGEAFEDYADKISPTKRGERWERVRLAVLGRDNVAKIQMADLTATDIAGWRDRRLTQVSGASVAREMNLLRSVLEVARKEWRWISINPAKDVRRPASPRPRQRRVSDDEVRKIAGALGWAEGGPVDTSRRRVAVAFMLAVETGMRAGEILSLRAETVFLDRRFVRLVDTKNGDAREVPLSTRAVELLKSLTPIEGRYFPVSSAVLDSLFRRARDAAGIEGLTFHDSRHEACTRLARKLSVLELARMIGHRDIRSLQIYFNATAAELAERLD